jgi:putative addiction module component (TIGR02574 family)
MTKDASELLRDALLLPPEMRAALADSLLESIDSDVDSDAESEWRNEIRKRVAELDSHRIGTVSWFDLENELRQAMHR